MLDAFLIVVVVAAMFAGGLNWLSRRRRRRFDHRPIGYYVTWHDLAASGLAWRNIRVTLGDYVVIRFLADLARARLANRVDAGKPERLAAYREDFRRVARDQPIVGLVRCLTSESAESRLLALWLLGHCGAKLAIPAVALLGTAESVRIRREAARALRRLEAWPQLRRLAEGEADPRIARIANSPGARPLEQRLDRYSRLVERVATPPRREPRELVLNAQQFVGRRPKPAWLIRRILERIRRVIRGGATSGNGTTNGA